jgi:hypothetical protein
MTTTEYNRMGRLICQHVSVGKDAAKERLATLKADFKQQLGINRRRR